MKVDRREAARKLRRERGLSIKAIAKRVGAAYSTVGLWVRDIHLNRSQRARLQERIGKAGGIATQKRWENLKEPWRVKAEKLLSERWWVIVTALYWAEGTRRGKDASMSNSEATLLKLFIEAAQRLVPKARITFKLSLPLRMGNEEKFKRWWEAALGKPSGWNKTIRTHTSAKTVNESYKGTMQVNVFDYRFRTMLMAAVKVMQQGLPE